MRGVRINNQGTGTRRIELTERQKVGIDNPMNETRMTKTETEQIQAALKGVKSQLSRIHHEINNPLSVISGNVQLLQELATVLGVQDDFSGPLQDIISAADQLAESADQLMVARNLLAQLDQ